MVAHIQTSGGGAWLRLRPGRRARRVLGFVAAAILLAAAGWAQAADQPRVAFLGTEVTGGAPVDVHLLDEAVVKGLRRADIAFVAIEAAAVPRTADGLICAGPTCLAQAATASGAAYFARAELRAPAEPSATAPAAAAFTGKVQIFRADPFQAVASGDFTCDACAAEALAQRFEQRATDAMTQALGAPPGDATGVSAKGVESEGRSQIGPWVAIGSGALLVGGGVYLIARGNQSACPGVAASECGQTYSDAKTGWLLGGVGVAAIAAGVAWGWLLPRDHGAPSGPRVSMVGIGPGGVAVGGQF
ncbi:MAG TPA: hypothetical protein VNO55_26950 [Polyangia bacterium]|nr:hypothetical protein [Polyangia bacterium]